MMKTDASGTKHGKVIAHERSVRRWESRIRAGANSLSNSVVSGAGATAAVEVRAIVRLPVAVTANDGVGARMEMDGSR